MAVALRTVLLAAGSFLAASAAPQTPPQVALYGSVSDIYVRDGRLPGATVTVKSRRSGITITLQTDPNGTFGVPALDPGTYTITVSKPGYGTLVASNFCVVRGRTARFDAGLGPDSGEATRATPPSTGTIVSVPPSLPAIGEMTQAEIQEAVAFGRRSPRLKAHQLAHVRGLTRRKTAFLFTPFWRVATAVQIAAASNRPFTEQEHHGAFIQKLGWIVAYPAEHYVNDYGNMDSPQYLAAVSKIVIRPEGSKNAIDDIEPVWKMYLTTDCDIDTLERVLGRQFTKPGMVAAFPTDSIRAGNTVLFIYGKSATPRDSLDGIEVKEEVRRITIKNGDVRKWK